MYKLRPRVVTSALKKEKKTDARNYHQDVCLMTFSGTCSERKKDDAIYTFSYLYTIVALFQLHKREFNHVILCYSLLDCTWSHWRMFVSDILINLYKNKKNNYVAVQQ